MMTPDPQESIRCSEPGCTCLGFLPGSVQLRSCDHCGHGWVGHALQKLQTLPPSSRGPVEVALPGLVFDLSSLVLYGSQAVPVQLKILLDRLYSILTPEQVSQILHTLGWSLGDYIRGYLLQDPSGKVLDRWVLVTPEEQRLVLKQFLRFGETRPIVEVMMLQSPRGDGHPAGPESRAGHKSRQEPVRRSRGPLESPLVTNDNTTPQSGNFPGWWSLLPFQFPYSTVRCLPPPTKFSSGFPSSKLTRILQKPSGTTHDHPGDRTEEDQELTWKYSGSDPKFSIKTDPDIPKPPLFLWHQNPVLQNEQELRPQGGMTKQEKPSPLPSPINSSLTPSFPYPPLSSSCRLQNSQKFRGPPLSLPSLPSFSSCLCPPGSSSFPSLPASSASLRPVPSSLCTLPSLSPAGGRKGRVCCGVCGKSFYDKGTLKIHYNAVHLKIKHGCTIAGCTMVFSSLRSRNRHSANPNPRLHTGAVRDAQPDQNTHSVSDTHLHEGEQHQCEEPTSRSRESRDTRWQQAPAHGDAMKNGEHGCWCNAPRLSASPPSSHPHTPDNLGLGLDRSQSRVPPLLLPAQPASSEGSPPSGTSLPCRWRWSSADPVPKKKSRKSSMPVKIERKTDQSPSLRNDGGV
ncbi:zinc finger protein basonuclin-2 [Nothobranchius furzeri]|uniref:zinc finger protein basonuclin-2 n=1 Tax=Nothobranchius furzeri TaxID=105023 RepID=UPI003904ABD2